MPRAHNAKDSEFKLGTPASQVHTALAPHDLTALVPNDYTAPAPHDYTAPAPHDSTAPAPSPWARYPNDSEFKFGPGSPKIANSSCPSTGLSKLCFVHPLLARIEPSFGLTSRTQRALRQISQNAAARAQLLSLDTNSAFQCQPSLVLHCSCFPTDFPCGNLKSKTLLLPNRHREHPSNSISARMIQSYATTPSTDSSPSS